MNLELVQLLSALVLFLIVVYLIGRILVKPLKLVFRLFYYLLFGLVLVWGFNYLGGFLGLHLPANLVTVFTAGILGVPGLVLMLVLQAWLGM